MKPHCAHFESTDLEVEECFFGGVTGFVVAGP